MEKTNPPCLSDLVIKHNGCVLFLLLSQVDACLHAHFPILPCCDWKDKQMGVKEWGSKILFTWWPKMHNITFGFYIKGCPETDAGARNGIVHAEGSMNHNTWTMYKKGPGKLSRLFVLC